MSQKPGVEALGELILQPEAPSQLLEIIPNARSVLQHNLRHPPPPPHECPSRMLDGIAPLKCPQKNFPPILIAFLEEKKMYSSAIFIALFNWRKNPT